MSTTTQCVPAIGSFCWFELNTRDVEGVKKFFGELLGWTTSPSQMAGEYHHWHDKDGVMFGGIMDMNCPEWGETPSHWMSYVAVEDCNAMVEKVTALGGNVCVPPTDIPTVGRFSVVSDPTGATFSVIQLDDPKPIAPVVVWTECMTRDAGKAKDFYTKLLGWTIETIPMGADGEYTMWKNGDTMLGGMMHMDGPQFENIPPHWLNYIGVEDIDNLASRISALGGTVVQPPMDIPNNMGRISVFSDPGGGHIAMYQSAQKK